MSPIFGIKLHGTDFNAVSRKYRLQINKMRHVLNNHHNQKVLKFTVTYVFYVKISRCESLTMIRVHRSNVESQKPYAPVEMWGCNEIGVEIARVMRKMMNRAHSSHHRCDRRCWCYLWNLVIENTPSIHIEGDWWYIFVKLAQSCKQSTFNFLFITKTFQSRIYYSSNFLNCSGCDALAKRK